MWQRIDSRGIRREGNHIIPPAELQFRPGRHIGLIMAGVVWSALVAVGSAEDALTRFEFLEIRLGIPVNIVLYAPTEAAAQQASRAAYGRLRDVDRMMSDFDPDSELMKLCQAAKPGKPQTVSPDLFQVLSKSRTFSEQSQGAFDVTVGPLVKVWRSARRQKVLPSAEAIAEAKQAVGYEHMVLNATALTITLNRPNMKIDLGAIAKGFAADRALEAMRSQGITRALVEAGGDIAVGDSPPGRDSWRIEIEKVRGEEGQPLVLKLANCGVATSGDAYQFHEINGVRYSHIVDTKTGLGLTRPGAVTVIAPDCLTADGLATAVTVLGPEKGLKLIAQHAGTHAMLLLASIPANPSHPLERFSSPMFANFIEQ